MRIACLHASTSNAAAFDKAAAEAGLEPGSLTHYARPDLLQTAMQAGRLPSAVLSETAEMLLELSTDTDAVLLTCSTLGPAADLAAQSTGVPIVRADAALAAEASAIVGDIVVLCTIEAALAPTEALFTVAARRPVRAALLPDAWQLFDRGEIAEYHRVIAIAADAAYEGGADLVVLGQASMSDAAQLVTSGPPPLTVPAAAIAAVMDALT